MAAPYSAEIGLAPNLGSRSAWLTETPARFLALLIVPIVIATAAISARPPGSDVLTPTGTGALIVSLGSTTAQVNGFDFSSSESIEITVISDRGTVSEKLRSETGVFQFAPANRPAPGDTFVARDGNSTAVVVVPAYSVQATASSISGTAEPSSTLMLSLDAPAVGLEEATIQVSESGRWSWAPRLEVTDTTNIYIASGTSGSSVELYLTGAEALSGFELG